MNILIELPTWLGDSVMATPAIENIIKRYPEAMITLFGTHVSTSIFVNHPNVKKIVLDESKASKFRWLWLYNKARGLGVFDVAISFRSSLSSRWLLANARVKQKAVYKKIRA